MWFMSYTNDSIVMFFSHGKVIHQIIFNSTNEWEKKWIRLWNSYSTPRVRVLNCELLRANHLTNHLHAASFFFFFFLPPPSNSLWAKAVPLFFLLHFWRFSVSEFPRSRDSSTVCISSLSRRFSSLSKHHFLKYWTILLLLLLGI